MASKAIQKVEGEARIRDAIKQRLRDMVEGCLAGVFLEVDSIDVKKAAEAGSVAEAFLLDAIEQAIEGGSALPAAVSTSSPPEHPR
jgi:hypothetical protein